MKEIKLTKGKVVLVNDEDYEFLSQWKWSASFNGYHWYAMRAVCKKGGKKAGYITIYMHRALMDAPKGAAVDHINGDSLDNRRCNLRLATTKENGRNRGPQKNGSSKYKGVTWYKPGRKWRAEIKIDEGRKHLGYFRTPEAAATAYNEAAKKYHGAFAWLNKLSETQEDIG